MTAATAQRQRRPKAAKWEGGKVYEQYTPGSFNILPIKYITLDCINWAKKLEEEMKRAAHHFSKVVSQCDVCVYVCVWFIYFRAQWSANEFT